MERPGIYLDHNATTPLSNHVKSLIPRILDTFGNPSSIHWAGRPAKLILREARRALAQMLQCDPLELVFTSGGSEANNTAIGGVFNAIASGWGWSGAVENDRSELVISSVEHPSVMKAAEALQRKGYRVHLVPVDSHSGICMDTYREVLSERTALVSIMAANNETGYVFPIKELCAIAHEHGALFHADAVQALGKSPIHLHDWNVDLASFSAHKFYALKGTGALYIKKGTPMDSLLYGGGQERGRRAGTENILGIAVFGEMARQREAVPTAVERVCGLRDLMEGLILSRIPNVHIVGGILPRLCNTSSFVIDGVDGETLLINLDVQGFAVSTGAACSSGNPEPSPVLLAMGLSRTQAQSSLRVSLGWHTTLEEIEMFVETLDKTVQRLRSFQGRENIANV